MSDRVGGPVNGDFFVCYLGLVPGYVGTVSSSMIDRSGNRSFGGFGLFTCTGSHSSDMTRYYVVAHCPRNIE